MSDIPPITGKVGLDVTDFKGGITQMNREIRIIESGFRATAAALGDWSQDAGGLEARIKSLTDVLEIQRVKVKALEAQYKAVAAEKGADSKAAQDLQVRINRENETLNKNQAALEDAQAGLAKMGDESRNAGKHVEELGKEEDETSKKTKHFGGVVIDLVGAIELGMKAIAGLVNAAIGMAKSVGNMLLSTIGPASDLSETINKVKVVFGDASEGILAFADNADTALGQTKQQALDAASVFAVFGKSAGLSGDDLVGFSNGFTTLASDLASFNNTSPQEAIDAIGAALRGESEPLRRYGVLLDDASMRQKALELGIVKTTKNALTPQQKILAAQALIFEQTADAQGDFARTSDGLANRQRIVRAQLENMKATIGTALLPAVEEAVNAFSNWLQNDDIQKGLADLAQWLSQSLPLAIKTFSQFWTNTLLPAIQRAWSWMQTTLIPFLQQLWTWLATTLPPAIQALSQFWTGTLLPAIQRAWSWMQANLIPFLQQLWTWLATNLPPAIQALSQFWTGTLLPAIQRAWSWMNGTLFPFLSDLASTLTTVVGSAVEALAGFWTGTLQPAIETVGGYINDYLLPYWTAVADLLSAVVGVAVTALAGLWQKVLQPALEKVWDFVSTSLQPVLEALSSVFSETLGPAIETVKANVLDKLPGAFDGIRNAIQWVIDKIEDLTEWFKKIKLPDALTPGSPTPFEIGLRGIAAAMRELNTLAGPTIGSLAPNPGVAGTTSSRSVYYSEDNTYYIQDRSAAAALAGQKEAARRARLNAGMAS